MTSPVDPSVPHNARVWDYWLGGTANFESDRVVGDRIRSMFPVISDVAVHSRRFLGRSVRYLAASGVRQFLDIGSGLPTVESTHSVAPDAQVVYVDNDPLVLQQGPALPGSFALVDADLHDVEAVLDGARRTLAFDQPVALLMLGVLNFVMDDEEARRIVRTLMAAVPAGSYLAITHPTVELGGEMNVPAMEFYNQRARPRIRARDRAVVETFFDGLSFVSPGLVSASRWRPAESSSEVPLWAGLARKPV